MANTFLAAKGVAMGGSLVDQDSIEVAKRILGGGARARVELPVDLVVADSLDAPTKIETVDVSSGLAEPQKAFDIGPKTIERYAAELKKAKTIFWNGPMGVFEKEEFAKGTMAMARAVAEAKAIEHRRRRRVGRSREGVRLRRSHQPHLDGRRRVAGVHLRRRFAGRGGTAEGGRGMNGAHPFSHPRWPRKSKSSSR